MSKMVIELKIGVLPPLASEEAKLSVEMLEYIPQVKLYVTNKIPLTKRIEN